MLSTFISPVDGVESSDLVDDESADESCGSVEDSADDVDVESPVEPDVDDSDDEPEVDDSDDEPEVDDSDDELDVESGSAHATPGVVATATPTPKATANPPTRPMYVAVPMVIPLASHRYGVVTCALLKRFAERLKVMCRPAAVADDDILARASMGEVSSGLLEIAP